MAARAPVVVYGPGAHLQHQPEITRAQQRSSLGRENRRRQSQGKALAPELPKRPRPDTSLGLPRLPEPLLSPSASTQSHGSLPKPSPFFASPPSPSSPRQCSAQPSCASPPRLTRPLRLGTLCSHNQVLQGPSSYLLRRLSPRSHRASPSEALPGHHFTERLSTCTVMQDLEVDKKTGGLDAGTLAVSVIRGCVTNTAKPRSTKQAWFSFHLTML